MLITGTNSGLGKYLSENIPGSEKLTRQNSKDILKAPYLNHDVIIHCAFNCDYNATNENIERFYEDNILLTEKLTSISTNKFIYISSAGVYETKNADTTLKEEESVIDLNNVKSFYGVTKLICESIVKKNIENYLIIRPSALLGKYSMGIIYKILNNKKITVSENSIYNFVLYSDLLYFIELSIIRNLTGIYNLTSSKNITINDTISSINAAHKQVKFGDYDFITPQISNSKITKHYPSLNRTSHETIQLWRTS